MGKRYQTDIETNQVDLGVLQGMGRAAALNAKHCGVEGGASAFGPKGRRIRSHRLQALRLSLLQGAQAPDRDAQALAVGEQVLAAGMDVAACLTLARTSLRENTIRQHQKEKDQAQALQAWSVSKGNELLAQVKQAVPCLASQDLLPIPTPKGALFMASCLDTDECKKTAAWAHASRASNLSTSLREAWSGLHKTLLEGECKPRSSQFREPVAPCLEAGVCLCSAEGRSLKRFCDAFKASMKKVFKASSDEKDLLVNASIVVRIVGSWAVDDYEAMLQMEEAERTIYFHIGLMYFSPYRPTFMVVEPVPGLPEIAASPDRLYVKASLGGRPGQ